MSLRKIDMPFTIKVSVKRNKRFPYKSIGLTIVVFLSIVFLATMIFFNAIDTTVIVGKKSRFTESIKVLDMRVPVTTNPPLVIVEVVNLTGNMTTTTDMTTTTTTTLKSRHSGYPYLNVDFEDGVSYKPSGADCGACCDGGLNR
jgi:hypothetical protein